MKSTMVTIIASVILSLLLFPLVYSQPHDLQKRNESVYERLNRTGTLNCIYIVWPPFVTKDANTGKLGGVTVEYTEALAKAMGWKVNWAQEGDIATYLEAVRTKRVDAECAAGFPTPERAKYADYTDAYAYVPEYVYARDDDHRFDNNIDLINNPNTVFVGIEGDTSYQNPTRVFPKATVKGLAAITPYSDLILNLITKKTDLIAMDVVTVVEYNKNNKQKIRQVPLPNPVNLGIVSMTIPKDEYDLKSAINIANKILLGNGVIDTILNKYDPNQEIFFRVSKPYEAKR